MAKEKTKKKTEKKPARPAVKFSGQVCDLLEKRGDTVAIQAKVGRVMVLADKVEPANDEAREILGA